MARFRHLSTRSLRDASGKVVERVVNGKWLMPMIRFVGLLSIKMAGWLHLAKSWAKWKRWLRDKNGKVIGGIVDGKVIDANGNVGRIDKNGQAIGLDGEVLGHVERVMRDKDGKVIAKVDGKMIDANGKVISVVGYLW